MTDSTKWKSVMVRTETYELLRDIADKDPRTISGILTDLIKQEWEWHFDRESRRKDPEEANKYAQAMMDCVKLEVPSKVDIECGPSWGEAA